MTPRTLLPKLRRPDSPRHLRRDVVMVNEYFTAHPEIVLGTHAQRLGICRIGRSYTCLPHSDRGSLEDQLDAALWLLPASINLPDPADLADDEPAKV